MVLIWKIASFVFSYPWQKENYHAEWGTELTVAVLEWLTVKTRRVKNIP